VPRVNETLLQWVKPGAGSPMARWVILLACALLPLGAGAAESKAWLAGSVTDALSLQALSGVEVQAQARLVETLPDGTLRLRPLAEVTPLGAAVQSDASGDFILEIPVGEQPRYLQVTARLAGYEEAGVALARAEPGRTNRLTLELVPLGVSAAELDLLADKQQSRRAQLLAANPSFAQSAWAEADFVLGAVAERGVAIIPAQDRAAGQLNGADKVQALPAEAAPTTFAVPDEVYVSNLSGFTGWLQFDEYLAGVVAAELGDGFPFEALKAQAVASRTYALERYNRTGIANGGQAYTADFTAGSKSRTAVINTRQVVMLYGGELIKAFFSARCNGDATLNSEDGLSCIPGGCADQCVVGGLGVGALPYARSRPCSGHPNCAQTSEPCCEVVIGGQTQHLYGHGVGLCQRGAQQFAGRDGLDWRQILEAFYTDIALANGPGLAIDGAVEVTTSLRVRATACGDTVKATMAAGTRGQIVGGPQRPVCALAAPNNYYTWWEVLYADGTRGWSVEDYLRLVPAPPCAYSLAPTNCAHGAGAEAGAFSVTAPSTCAWTAGTSDAWITITAGQAGNGNGTVTYQLASNTSYGERTGAITVQGQAFTVSQAGQPPRLAIALFGAEAVFSWPADATGYALETATSLCPPTWTKLADTPAVVGGQWVLKAPATGPAQYFRLSR
jgi:hypothetical protein